MNFKGHLGLIYGSVPAFGFDASSIQTTGFQGARGCRWGAATRVGGHLPPPGLAGFPAVLHLQVPLLPPSFLRVAPGAAGEEEEERALE